MKKVPIVSVDEYQVHVALLPDPSDAHPCLTFTVSTVTFYPTGDVFVWHDILGVVWTVPVSRIEYITHTPSKTHTEEVEVP